MYRTPIGEVGLGVAPWLITATMAACSGSAVVDGAPGTGGSTSASGCAERIREVTCRAEPPKCPADQFPAAMPDGSCWTGECLDCIDGYQDDADCLVVEACGCYHHEGCRWAESRYRAALLPACVRISGETCTSACSSEVCGQLDCPWCDADGAECDDGTCRSIVSHECY